MIQLKCKSGDDAVLPIGKHGEVATQGETAVTALRLEIIKRILSI